jgi:GT2 family glycosyltransferase
VPTYNGAHKILNVLRALERQTHLPDEVVVVIDGSTDGTAELLRSNSFSLKNLRIIEQVNGGRAQVRNRGAKEAGNDLLIFFDDDMRPEPQSVAEHIAHHLRHPGSILTGGLMEEVTAQSKDLLRFRSGLSEKWNEPLLPYRDKAMPRDMSFLTAANCSMYKSVWDSIGGLDEELNDAEDYDMATRASRIGIPMYFNVDAFAWHDDPVTCASYIRRLRQYAAAQQKLQILKPELYTATHKFAIRKPTGLKAIFFKMFCFPFWIRTIDSDFWTFLPTSKRFKLYDWVVTSNGSFYPEKVRL